MLLVKLCQKCLNSSVHKDSVLVIVTYTTWSLIVSVLEVAWAQLGSGSLMRWYGSQAVTGDRVISKAFSLPCLAADTGYS